MILKTLVNPVQGLTTAPPLSYKPRHDVYDRSRPSCVLASPPHRWRAGDRVRGADRSKLKAQKRFPKPAADAELVAGFYLYFMTSRIPAGMRYYIGAEARLRRTVEDVAMSVFQAWNYEEVITPSVD